MESLNLHASRMRSRSRQFRHFIKKLGCKRGQTLHFTLVHDTMARKPTLPTSQSKTRAMTLHKPLNQLESRLSRITLLTPAKREVPLLRKNKEGYAVFMTVNYREEARGRFKGVRAHFIDVDLNKISELLDTREEAERRMQELKADRLEQIQSISVTPTKQGLYQLLAQRGKRRVRQLKQKFLAKHRKLIRGAMIVETKNGYHIYWTIRKGSIGWFVPIQRALARKFNSDPKITDLARVMRVPGFYHRKNPASPYLVCVKSWGRKQPFTQAELIRSLALTL
ncbi:DNA-primase RepB domain-containing protein [Paenibacillus sp. CF384]|uniref:DNA-primase RepB domain-containing protein n=1 Tax=Paenibacillus sp. CF384 TaxID=1884382 RepID=UPI000899B55C|nr:DNA-primase RepB domain-containing protein [Paenibacillus sp. CF384]SDX04891.1 RepB DNA-primase [Paenibacillus sp. CF384]